MTPRRRKPKGERSSPKNKVKKVLARWSDGLFYVIKILKVSEKKKRCLVEFEDQSTAYVHFKDLLDEHNEEAEARTCYNCGGADQLENNAFIRCTNCDREFHRHCHVPPIISDPMAKQFVCRICVFAACAKAGGAKATGPMAARYNFMKREFPYDLEHLSWNPSHTSNSSECYCYCGGPGSFFNKMLQCCRCYQWFHEACVQCLSGELLMGDRFYIFACAHCNFGEEFLRRLDTSWQNVLYISIFHLSMTQSLKYTDMDADLIPFLRQQADSFNLHKLFNTQDVDKEFLRQIIINVVTTQTDTYCCGAEVKKKQSLYGLRERIPPPPPSFHIPHKTEKISNLTLTNLQGKKTLFKPPKYMNSLPYLIRGANKFIPSTMSLKLKEASMARLKSEHNYCSTSDEYSSSSDRDSIVSKENYDANNNSSPLKPSSSSSSPPLLMEIKKEPPFYDKERFGVNKKFADEQSVSSSDGSEDADSIERMCPVSYFNNSIVWEGGDRRTKMKRGTDFWSLDTAFPEPRDFSGINNPFLTDIEQSDLKQQRSHFMRQLEHLSQTMDSYVGGRDSTSDPTTPSQQSTLSSSPCNDETPPVSVPSSPLLTNIKGFKGELAKILKTNGCSSVSPSLRSKLNNPHSPGNNNNHHRHHKSSPEKVSVNTHHHHHHHHNTPKTRQSDSFMTSSNGSNHPDTIDKHNGSMSSPSDIINSVKLSPKVAARLAGRKNGVRRLQRSSSSAANSHEARQEEKRLKAMQRCLKNLTPTCGFHFPVLDRNHPGVANGVDLDFEPEEPESKPSDLGRRGLKRKHSNVNRNISSKNLRKSASIDDEDDDDDDDDNCASSENIRRSHRSRQAVKRFETAGTNGHKRSSINAQVQMNSSILNMAKYSVVSLRLRHDNTIDYLIDWNDQEKQTC